MITAREHYHYHSEPFAELTQVSPQRQQGRPLLALRVQFCGSSYFTTLLVDSMIP
jgi:hypothetical protein